jgi:hypothetical protein
METDVKINARALEKVFPASTGAAGSNAAVGDQLERPSGVAVTAWREAACFAAR